MTIGLLLLAAVSILIFFGFTEGLFVKLGIKSWLAFLLVVALVAGAVAPSFTIAGAVSLNIGGFLVPLVIMVILFALMRSPSEVLRAMTALIAVASVAVGTRILIEPNNAGLILSSSLIVGFAGGTVAFVAGKSRLSTLAAAIGGIVLGDIVTSFLYRFTLEGYGFALGIYGVFDSLIIAAVFAVILFEVIGSIRKANTQKRIADGSLAFEAADDAELTGGESREAQRAECPAVEEMHEEIKARHDDFFDDYI